MCGSWGVMSSVARGYPAWPHLRSHRVKSTYCIAHTGKLQRMFAPENSSSTAANLTQNKDLKDPLLNEKYNLRRQPLLFCSKFWPQPTIQGQCIDTDDSPGNVLKPLKLFWPFILPRQQCVSQHTLMTWLFIAMCRLGRFLMGRRNALAVEHLAHAKVWCYGCTWQLLDNKTNRREGLNYFQGGCSN